MVTRKTTITFKVAVDDVLFDAFAFQHGTHPPATTEDVARHAAVVLGVMHREMIAQYRRGQRMFSPTILEGKS
jgi:hypothetical protein